MTATHFTTFLMLLCILTINAQGEADNWYFGENAGLNFSSGSPTALIDGQLATLEGCATISNADGALLFYTDGISVWDKTHVQMPNGTGLQGDTSSSQSGIIVPNPAKINQYYVFSVDDKSASGGLYYSIVDLTLNGGNGDIIAGQKNIVLLQRSAEKIAAVQDDGNGYWLLSYAGPTGAEIIYNTFHAFRINATGIDTASITSTHSACATDDGRGYLKIAPDASKIVICNQNQNHVCLHDFDQVTGSIGNELQLPTTNTPYCAEFSGSSEKVYVSTGDFLQETTYLQQFDLLASDIPNSRTDIFSQFTYRAALQLAIDGKIYYARPNQTHVGVINQPEQLGLACNYVDIGVDLNGRTCRQGLPPFIQSFFLVGFDVENTCMGDTTQFSVNSNEPITSIFWDFGDGNTSTEEQPAHNYANPGTYTVNVTVNAATGSRNLTQQVTIHEIPIANAISDFIVCDWTPMNNSITVLVNGLGDYEYSLDNIFYQDSNVFNGLAPGSYLVYVRDKNGCGIVSDDVFLLYYPKYFTPNGDGYHETWQIISSRAEPNLEIYIFDRYGKLITSLDPLSLGWDGTYNGNELPSTDYWFKVIRPNNGKEYRGHFSLKR